MSSKVPKGGITARINHSVRVGQHLQRELPRRLQNFDRYATSPRDARRWRFKRFGLITKTGGKKRGALAKDDQLALAEVLETYVDAYEGGHTNTNQVTALALGLTAPVVTKRIHRLRKLAWLSETEQGRPGGQLTSQGRAAIAELRHERALRQKKG